MQDISNMNREGLPSSKSLFKATGVAAVIGGVVLVTTILPAEYGIDPTGLGQTMGLTVLSQANAAESAQPESAPASSGNLLALSAGPVWKTPEGLSSDSTTVTLGPNEGLEVKATMAEGDRMVFNWTTEGGSVNGSMTATISPATGRGATSRLRAEHLRHRLTVRMDGTGKIAEKQLSLWFLTPAGFTAALARSNSIIDP